MKYYLAAPFGNHLTQTHMYSVMGTYTLHPRTGLLQQILKTLRYSFHYKGWTNKLGLRNSGIEEGIQKYCLDPHHKLISIYGFNQKEWKELSKRTKGLRIELNLSCPNIQGKGGYNTSCPVELFDKNAIVKMSPLTTEKEIIMYMERGVRNWHFSNTLPIAQGGLSGRTLMAYNKKLIKFTIGEDRGAKIIGGGGIRNMADVRFYRDLGCSGVSLGTVCFWPFALRRFSRDASDSSSKPINNTDTL